MTLKKPFIVSKGETADHSKTIITAYWPDSSVHHVSYTKHSYMYVPITQSALCVISQTQLHVRTDYTEW